MRLRPSSLISLLVLLATVGAACAGGSRSPNASRSVVIADAAGPAGTPLGDGFSVADGTTLIGDPVPLGVVAYENDNPILDDGWVATSVVDEGEPRKILDDHLRQSEEVGLLEEDGTGCGRDVDVVICAAFARSPEGDEPRSLSVVVVRGTRADVVSNHVVVRYSTTDLYWSYGRPNVIAGEIGDDPAPSWPPLPEVGDPIGTAGEMGTNVVVREGTRVAGPPRLNLDDVTGGVVAILEVTGDPSEVLTAYIQALPDAGSRPESPDVREIGDVRLTTASYSEAGGDQFRFTIVERRDRPTWLVIDGSHD